MWKLTVSSGLSGGCLAAVLVQPELEKRRSPLVSIPPFGRGFSRHAGLSSDDSFWSSVCSAREEHPALDIGSMSPPDYPSAWLHPCRARLRFARQDHCSSVTACRFSTSLARDSARTQTCQTRIVSVIAYVTPTCSRAAALRRHPLGKIVKRTREEMVIRAECGGLRSFTQLLARLPLVFLAEALTGRLRSQGIRSHQ